MLRTFKALTTLLLVALSSACGVTFKIHAPAASSLRYAGQPAAQALAVQDTRPRDTDFSDGTMSVNFKFDGFEGDHRELAYMQAAVEQELATRGIPIARNGEAEPITIHVRDFGVRNRQVIAMSPVVTYTRFSADLTRSGQTVRVAAYSKQVKVPKWGVGELEGPCFNRPLHVVAGEIAAKLNQAFVNAQSDDAQVASLTARAQEAKGEPLLQLINELGWSNNPNALPTLLQLAHAETEVVRGTALGAIGTLGVPQSLAPLQEIYQNPPSDTDRYLALKAIGDLTSKSPEALMFLASVHASPGDNERDINEITKLYLDGRPPAATANAMPLASAQR